MYVSLSALTSGLFGRSSGFMPDPRVNGEGGLSAQNGDSMPVAPRGGAVSSDAHGIPASKGLAHVRSQVDRQLGIPGADGNASGPYSGSDVAGHVLDFVSRRLQQAAANGQGTDQLRTLLHEARSGVAQGFQQAREALKSTGRLSDALGSAIQDTLAQINKGLDALSRQYLGDPSAAASPPQSSPVDIGQVSGVGQGASVAYDSKEALKLSVRTAEGDRVSISLSERQYLGASASVQAGASGVQAQYTQSSLFSGRYQVTVQGSLSPGEQKAISDLIGRVQTVANRFFDGDVQGAFQQASQLGLDGGQLAQFSLSLSSVQSVRAAAYSSNQAPDAGSSSSSQPASALQPVGDLAASVKQAQGHARHIGLDAAGLRHLFSHLLAQAGSSRGHTEHSPYRQTVDAFLKSLLDVAGQTSAPATNQAARSVSRHN